MTDQLAQYSPQQYNVLVPTQTIQQVSPWHAARVSEVRANPDPNGGDVFKVGSRFNEAKKEWEDLFTPCKPLLMRISQAAGIVWNWRESGFRILTRDHVLHESVGALRLPDGSWLPMKSSKELDLTVVEEELLESNLKKAQQLAKGTEKDKAKLAGMEPEAWAQAQTRSNMIQWRKNKAMRAETGSMLRLIRAALGMKMQFTKEELQRPFLVPRIDFSPDYSDPQVRQALIENGVQGMAKLYSGSVPGGASGQAFAGGQEALVEGPVREAFVVDGGEDADDAPTVVTSSGQPVHPAVVAALFPDQAAGSASPEAGLQAQPAAEVIADCTDCGAPITNGKVVDFSVGKFGRPLCYPCQKKQPKGGEQAS